MRLGCPSGPQSVLWLIREPCREQPKAGALSKAGALPSRCVSTGALASQSTLEALRSRVCASRTRARPARRTGPPKGPMRFALETLSRDGLLIARDAAAQRTSPCGTEERTATREATVSAPAGGVWAEVRACVRVGVCVRVCVFQGRDGLPWMRHSAPRCVPQAC